ncbi:alpha/beta hydrolase [Terrabacter sp. RAF57]|uniref:alpha/beta hydrolase n=1 Tax=Terrabacter sp. RAF57 TaxID=3233063 RepID=UPI003F94FDB0
MALLLAALLAGAAPGSSHAIGITGQTGATGHPTVGSGWGALGRPSASGAGLAGATGAGSAKPTVVLVHGAFADSSGWSQSISQLTGDGFSVLAVANPLRGLTADSDYVRSVLQTIAGPIVLVGHSYGGAVITNAARGVPNVRALVYVGAFVPDTGESIASAADPSRFPGSLLGPSTTIVRPVTNPAAAGGQDVDIYIALDAFRRVFAGDVSAERAGVMARTQRPLTATANFEPSGEPAWRTVPSWDLITTADNAIPPAAQQFMAERAGAHISTVASAHDVMVSHPAAVTKIVEQAARAVS